MTSPISRRDFLKHGSAASAGAAVGAPMVLNLLASATAQAATSAPYRALVCVFMAGGNDSYNTVIRKDKGLDSYLAVRGGICDKVVIPKSTNPASPDYFKAMLADETKMLLSASKVAEAGLETDLALALHPALSYFKQRFDAGQLAIIGNIGPLVGPVTKAGFESALPPVLPPKLFSHNDQTSVWQSGKAEGSVTGWGGEMVRRATLTTPNKIKVGTTQVVDHTFSAVGMDSTPVFCFGTATGLPSSPLPVLPYGASNESGALRLGHSKADWFSIAVPTGGPELNTHWDRNQLLADLFSGKAGTSDGPTAGVSMGHLIEADYATKLNNTNRSWQLLSQALGQVTPPEGLSLSKQLEMVAKLIKARDKGQLAMARQVFYVQLNGFDTHSGQTAAPNEASAHDKLLTEVNDAVQKFYTLLDTDSAHVVTFTASEFGRKFNKNGDGTDHGWGAHHFVMGGGVKGGVYGQFPDPTLDANRKYTNSQVLSGDGTMVPKVSVDNLMYQLGGWLGVDWTNADVLKGILPNYTNNVANEPSLAGILPK